MVSSDPSPPLTSTIDHAPIMNTPLADGQLWKEVKQEVDYLLKPQVLAAAERHIRAANLSRIVLIDNLQQVIEVENPPAEKIAELQSRKGE